MDVHAKRTPYVDDQWRPTISYALAERYQGDLSVIASCSWSNYSDSKVHGANIKSTWVLSAQGRAHVDPINYQGIYFK